MHGVVGQPFGRAEHRKQAIAQDLVRVSPRCLLTAESYSGSGRSSPGQVPVVRAKARRL